MEKWGFTICLPFLLILAQICLGHDQIHGRLSPGFEASRLNYIDDNGLFLLSNDSRFAFGFQSSQNISLFLLVIIHQATSTVIWTANKDTPVGDVDIFEFGTKGRVTLQAQGNVVWAPEIDDVSVSSILLENSGNLVFLKSDNSIVWQSFSHPTNTLVSNQDFSQGMKLSSDVGVVSGNLIYFLEFNSGDLDLFAGYKTPQIYWSMSKDNRKIINQEDGVASLARIEANSWRFYDQNKVLLWEFIFAEDSTNSSWILVIGDDGFITFFNLDTPSYNLASPVKIPSDPCKTPEPCGPYETCFGSNKCQCPSGLFRRSCQTGISSPCKATSSPSQLVYAGDGLSYFALGFVQPSLNTTLNGCKYSCTSNCSCLALFFDNRFGSCYLFDRVGSFLPDNTSTYSVFVKVSDIRNGKSNRKHRVIIIVVILLIILGMVCGGYYYYNYYYQYCCRKNKVPELHFETAEDNFLGTLPGMSVRYKYQELQDATNNFSVKLGEGGFGSVYQGVLPDGSRLAVKKLEGIGQGKKEFQAEVSIVGRIHHVHLVRLNGFCSEGTHRLLAYEFMPNGSLDKWIFKEKDDNESVFDWETRFNIALGTAKGLAYLHEECDPKILHCDIKPENVLLGNHFEAKVSDFGLARLMSREQSKIVTKLRGTRGYLAPEWILNYPISEKCDVYSFGMLLLEIIGGRRNYDLRESSEKSHFPSHAFKMMEQGRFEEILDSRLEYEPHEESVQTAIKVALWCIQEDMSIRPSMTKVVQMLEGICLVPRPPMCCFSGRIFSNFFKKVREEEAKNGLSSGPAGYSTDASLPR